jgi:hypothetical protein
MTILVCVQMWARWLGVFAIFLVAYLTIRGDIRGCWYRESREMQPNAGFFLYFRAPCTLCVQVQLPGPVQLPTQPTMVRPSLWRGPYLSAAGTYGTDSNLHAFRTQNLSLSGRPGRKQKRCLCKLQCNLSSLRVIYAHAIKKMVVTCMPQNVS